MVEMNHLVCKNIPKLISQSFIRNKSKKYKWISPIIYLAPLIFFSIRDYGVKYMK